MQYRLATTRGKRLWKTLTMMWRRYVERMARVVAVIVRNTSMAAVGTRGFGWGRERAAGSQIYGHVAPLNNASQRDTRSQEHAESDIRHTPFRVQQKRPRRHRAKSADVRRMHCRGKDSRGSGFASINVWSELAAVAIVNLFLPLALGQAHPKSTPPGAEGRWPAFLG